VGVFIHGYVGESARVPRFSAPEIVDAIDPLIVVADVKKHLLRDTPDEDGEVANWILAAIAKVERDTGLILFTKQLDLPVDRFPSGGLFKLPYAPLVSVDAINTTSSAGADTEFDEDSYFKVDRQSFALADTASWPSDLRTYRPIVIRATFGWETLAEVPQDLVHAVKLVIGWLSKKREIAAFDEPGYEQWICNHRTLLTV
jgi:uncharacterized phiE125 gp8 family phage protein